MTGGIGLCFATTPQSQLRFDSSPCTGAPSNRKILRKENRPERARRAYITCAERNHHAAGTSRAYKAHITFVNLPEGHTSLARSAIITPQAHHARVARTSLLSTCPKGIHHLRGAQSSRRRHITRAERAHHFFVAGVPCSFVRNGNELRSNSRRRKKERRSNERLLDSGSCLSSRAVSSQVLSVYVRLTSVFGMGTGGTAQLNHRKGVLPSNLKTAYRNSL